MSTIVDHGPYGPCWSSSAALLRGGRLALLGNLQRLLLLCLCMTLADSQM